MVFNTGRNAYEHADEETPKPRSGHRVSQP